MLDAYRDRLRETNSYEDVEITSCLVLDQAVLVIYYVKQMVEPMAYGAPKVEDKQQRMCLFHGGTTNIIEDRIAHR